MKKENAGAVAIIIGLGMIVVGSFLQPPVEKDETDKKPAKSAYDPKEYFKSRSTK